MEILPSRYYRFSNVAKIGVFSIFLESPLEGEVQSFFSPSNRLEEGKERFLLEYDANKNTLGIAHNYIQVAILKILNIC